MEEFEGLLSYERCPGYRSPFRLRLDDGRVIELRGGRLDAAVGRRVRVRGEFVDTPGGPAPEESEAYSRFLDHQIPALHYFHVKEIL